ncbi:MAG: TIGR04255 family protein [Candidatus Accumulibacter cognatus]|uniref:TIGR04255 family protein n=1 Tax=Candidatus Accumulibacter cognatus TaxID=2954383 RepID=A0A7D5NA42_9PROT|nr:MAG: TIGR04255 family protein [Candidatus Accumulibacter cognatus]
MNRIPKRLKKEPLIEAIWQVQFESAAGVPIGDLLPGVLFTALRSQHGGLQLERLPSADIPAQMAQFDPNLRHMAKYRMEDKNSPFIFQVGDRIITLNCRRPYAGWTEFKEKILALVKVVENSGLVPAPMRHSLRYIDLLTLEPAPSLSFLQMSMKMGAFDIQSRPMQTRVELLEGNCTHVVQIATPAQVQFPEGMKDGAIVDLETFPAESLKGWSEIATQIDHLHERSKALFFENILTDKAIELMEPEY